MERFPKKGKEEIDEDSTEEVTNDELEVMAGEVASMTPADRVAYAQREIEDSRERMRFQNEQIAHLKAEIEHLTERMRTAEGAERTFAEEQLAQKQELLDEYHTDIAEETELTQDAGDLLDEMKEHYKQGLN